MSNKEKIKKKIDAEVKKCPFSLLKDNCITGLCMSWHYTNDDYGYCVLIQDR